MPDPIMNAGSDVTILYSVISGGSTTQALSGSATVFSPGTAISTWTWTLLEKPSGSSASLSATNVQNPTLNNIDTAGTYRLFLQGTDDAAQSSESDRLKAPSTAFVTISVTSQYASIAKPAPGQRNWHDEYWGLVDAVDANKNTVDTHIADTADPHQTLANTATVNVTNDPALNDVLKATSTTTAAWGASSTTDSAVGVKGVIECAETPFSASNPKAVTRDKIAFSGSCLGTLKSGGFTPWEVNVPAAVVGVGSTPSPYCIRFYIPVNMYVTTLTCTMEDSGAGTGNTSLETRSLSTANFLANAAGTLLISTTLAPQTGQGPITSVQAINQSVTAGRWIGIVVTAVPATAAGGGLNVQLDGYQEF